MKTRLSRSYISILAMGALLAGTAGSALAAQSPQIPLAAKTIPQFVQPLPTLNVQGGSIRTLLGNQPLTMRMCEFKANVLPPAAVVGYTGTWVWGYLPDPTGNTSCQALVDQYDDGVINSSSGPLNTYTGPVVVNDRGTSTPVTYINDLGSAATTNVLAYKYSTDQTLHWADPLNSEMNMCNHMAMYPLPGSPCAQNYNDVIPAVPHLHGGEVPPEIDGSPDSWFTSDGLKKGHGYYTSKVPGDVAPSNGTIFRYPNTQEAGPLWFHDHTLGATRLNVYAGLAGGYFIEDPAILPASTTTTRGTKGTCTAGCLPANIQPIAEVVPIVLQDRMFDTNGQLFYPADSAAGILWAPNPEHPYWKPEFVGDTVVVNGKAWPYQSVQGKRYRFLFLNGSNARTYEMSLINQTTGAVGPPMWIIGSDGGYLDTPVKIDPTLGQTLTMMPGERYEVIIDFTGFANSNLVLRNTGRTPYPKGTPPQGSTLGRIMQFRVGPAVADASYAPSTLAPLRSGANAIIRLTAAGAPIAAPAKTRSLTLNEVMWMAKTVPDPVTGTLTAYPGGPLEILVNNTKWSGERTTGVNTATGMYTMAPIPGYTLDGAGKNSISELPREGDTEVWEIVNLTADAHPIHLHLVQFQLMSRQDFNKSNYVKAYAATFPGGGIDPMTGLAYPVGVYIPAFGPPLGYNPSVASGSKHGGNPDVTPFLQGPLQLPLPQENGWKDTVIMLPGQVTRIVMRWAPTTLPAATQSASLNFPFDPYSGGMFNYVWHCHIIDHEDNEMMRPNMVPLNPSAPAPSMRPLVKGVSY